MPKPCLKDIDVAVLAGGLGTRIHACLKDTPKIMAPVNGRPFLEYLLCWLENYGARRVVMCLGHLGDRVGAWLENNPTSLEVVISQESDLLGTAGALRHAKNHLKSNPVMVMNGDSYVDTDLCALLAAHDKGGAGATLLCTEVDDARRFGHVSVGADGRILSFEEKCLDVSGPGLINAGVYVLSSDFLDSLAVEKENSLEKDVFTSRPSGELNAYVGRFPFIDIGTPESLDAASRILPILES